MDYILNDITQGAEYLSVSASQFKTNSAVLSLAVPLSRDTVSANAVALSLLSRRCEKYPTQLSLNKKLASLYGAALSCSSAKSGDSQVLKLGITCVDDRFSLDGESISLEAVELLFEMFTKPRLENGVFPEAEVESEKRIVLQKIEADENEKRVYALNRAEVLMFSDEAFGTSRYGTKEQVASLTAQEVTDAWHSLLENAKILLVTVGSCNIQSVLASAKSALSGIERGFNALPVSKVRKPSDSIKELTERLDVKQGKLVMGFNVELASTDPLTPAMRTTIDIFGGGPYSKLFANVREKMSLCYYCSAAYYKHKSAMFVQSGCNEENMDKAQAEILNQLEALKNGDFDEEFTSSVISIADTIKSLNDLPDVLAMWYSNQITLDEYKTPAQLIKENSEVTKEQVIECAKLITLDTVYRLAAPKEEK